MQDDFFKKLFIALLAAAIIVGGSILLSWLNEQFPLDDLNDPYKPVNYVDSVWDADEGFHYSQD